jgi:hypothetical protein
MDTKPVDEEKNWGWALAQSLLGAAVQGLIRAMIDIVLGGSGRDLF